MAVDNFDLIRDMLDFSDDDKFYYLQILQRKKENPQLGSNSKSVKDYRIRSLKHFDALREEIIGISEYFNARASIRLNRRSYKQVAFKTMEKIVGQFGNEDYVSVKYAYNKSMGANHNETNKTWILDIDDFDFPEEEFRNDLKSVLPDLGDDKVVAKIPSKNGYHLIVRPFNVGAFMLNAKWRNIDIHKDNPTNLYIK